MKKILKRIAVSTLALTLGMSCLAGCAPARAEYDQKLEVFIENAGYGIDGVTAALYAFAEQDWVKAKYPNLEIPKPVDEKLPGYGMNKIENPSRNNFDLIFVTGDLSKYFGKNGKGESTLVELTDVFEDTVPNENIKFKDKMIPANLDYVTYVNSDGDAEYYDFPWCSGNISIVYNPDIVDNYMDYVPRTTDELINLVKQIKAGPANKQSMTPAEIAAWNKENCGNEGGFSFTPCGTAAYEGYMFQPWWAQYDGYETYENFWKGLYDDGSGDLTLSHKIYEAEGRLKSMEVLYEILNYDSEYYDLAQSEDHYIVAQTALLKGEYAFTFCADWFDSEMKTTREAMKAEFEAGVAGSMMPKNLNILKSPVISDIVEQLKYRNSDSSFMTDEQLSFLIECIDTKKSYAEAKTEFEKQYPVTVGDAKTELKSKDYERIMEARAIFQTGAMGHTACIPSVSNSIDVAKDFVRFLATDVAQFAYMKGSEGQTIPFKFDHTSDAPLYGTNKTVAQYYIEEYASFSPMQQSRHEIFFNTFNPVKMLSSTTRNPLAKNGLKAIDSSTNVGWLFREDNSPTPLSLFNATKAKFDADTFKRICFEAGLIDSYA